MNNIVKLNIEFISIKEAAIGITLANPHNNPDFAMIVLFASFSLRQMRNLGATHPCSRSLAHALATVKDPQLPIRTLLGPPDLSLNTMRQSLREDGPDPMQNIVSIDTVELVRYNGQKGKKRFLAEVKIDERRALLQLDLPGFDMSGIGVNYYAPLSVGLPLKRLAFLQGEHAEYLHRLAKVANLCGQAILSDAVTSIDQIFLAIEFGNQAVQ